MAWSRRRRWALGLADAAAAVVVLAVGGTFLYIHVISGPAPGTVRTYSVTADLTLHGHTRAVTFPLSAERTAAEIEMSGSIPILFADWDIPNPSFTGFVTTQNHGTLEFLLKLARS